MCQKELQTKRLIKELIFIMRIIRLNDSSVLLVPTIIVSILFAGCAIGLFQEKN